MKKKVILYIFSLLFLINSFVFGDNLKKAEEALNHASTYHWLARYKHNDSRDLLTSKKYFERAKILLESIKKTPDIIRLLDKANAGFLDATVRYDNSLPNLSNKYPIYNILTGNSKAYEFYDDANEVACGKAIEDAIETIPYPMKSDFQYNVIVLSDPVNTELEDELRVILNLQSHFYPRPVEEILDVISLDEYNKLYEDEKSNLSILQKLASNWNKNKLLIAKIIENDQVDDISYMGIFLNEWDSHSIDYPLKSVYSDGFVEDRTDYRSRYLTIFCILLLLAFTLPVATKFTFLFKDEKERRPVYGWSGVYSYIITVIIIYAIVYLFRTLAPDPTSWATMNQSQIWILLFHIMIVLVPMIIIYLLSVITPKINERMNDGETIASILGGFVLGLCFVFSTIYLLQFPDISLFILFITMSLLCYGYSIWVGHHLSLFFIKNKKYGIIPLISFILILELLLYSLMSYNFDLLYIANCSIIFFPFIFHGIRRYLKYKALQGRTNVIDTSEDKISMEYFLTQINEPKIFIDPLQEGDFISGKVKHFTESFKSSVNNKLKIFLISGPQGSGKTRLAIRLAEETIKEFNKNNLAGDESNDWILFGDCDELNQSGTGVPFEPFSQALHDILGAGRFEPPSKKANKIKEGINSTGLGNILDMAGLGVLNLILGAEDEAVKSATTSEMVQIISQALVGLSKSRPVIFIMDDLHWIDPITNILFETLLTKLAQELTPNIFFIFTSRIKKEVEDSTKPNPLKYLRKCNNDGIIDLKEILNEEFEYKERFEDILIKSLHFDRYSVQKYLQFIDSYEVRNILSFLQTIKTIIDQDGIEIINNRVKIIKNFDFTKLPPPTHIIDIIGQQLQTLSSSQLQIIKFASFIGHEFKASILTEALKLGRLKVLYDLQILEEKNIIVDIRSQDDVYEFVSNAMINVVRYMSNDAENQKNEIPQIVREFHYRIAKSFQEKMKLQKVSISTMKNQDLYNIAKRSWASGDRMISDAFEYNYEAILRAFRQFRYEEAILFGSNIFDIIEKFESVEKLQEIIRVYLIVAQSKIIIGLDAAGIDEVIEAAKLLVDKSGTLDKEFWYLVILNVEADAVIHDHSDFFEKQREEILTQINIVIQASGDKSNFELLYAYLSQIRLDDNISPEKEFEKIKLLLQKVRNFNIDDKEQTETALSGFSHNPNIDYKFLESEILEEFIRMMFIKGTNSKDIIVSLKECEEIKSSIEINDKEGLAFVYHSLGKCHLDLDDKDKADYYFNKTFDFGKKIGSIYYESEGLIGRGKIMLISEDYDGALNQFRSVSKLNIWDDKEIQYEMYIGILKIANINNDIDLKNEYLSDFKNLIKHDENKGYLCEELRALISNGI